MDISDLTNELTRGQTFAETASFLCRDEAEVRQTAGTGTCRWASQRKAPPKRDQRRLKPAVCRAINQALTHPSVYLRLSDPRPATPQRQTSGAVWASLAGGLVFLVLHQAFRNSLSPQAMTPAFVEGELPVLESLGFFLALLSIWFWAHS